MEAEEEDDPATRNLEKGADPRYRGRTGILAGQLRNLADTHCGGVQSCSLDFCVSYSLLRFFDKLPTKSPILKSVVLGFIALIIVTMLIEVPARLLMTTSDPARYFLIGAMINVVRLLALGGVVGYLYDRLDGRVTR